MKKTAALFLILTFAVCLAGCGSKLVEGSQKTYCGVVVDRAMSVDHEGDIRGRAYITVATEEGDICFWLARGCETDAQVGDSVTVESAIEAQTQLLVAITVTAQADSSETLH